MNRPPRILRPASNSFTSGQGVMLGAGLFVAALLLTIGIGAILVLNPTGGWADAVDWDRVRYALKSAGFQAFLSAFCSLIIAVPASLAVARRAHWPLMKPLVTVVSLAMVLPTTVAAMGLLAVWGRKGVMLETCRSLGFEFCGDITIYGLHGVVLAHMMLNVPLMMRVFIPLISAIPERRYHLTALLSLGMLGRFRHVELPQIKQAIPGVLSLVFLMCFTSFSLVLMLGGGPKVTTLEVEIYSAVRFDFNLAAAAGLSLIQFGCAALVVLVLSTKAQFEQPAPLTSLDKTYHRRDLGKAELTLDSVMMAVMMGLVILPMVMVAVKGVGPDLIKVMGRPQFMAALKASLSVSFVSAFIVLILSLMMGYARAVLTIPNRLGQRHWARGLVALLDAGIMLYLVIPSIVLGTASFIVLRSYGDVFSYGVAVVILANVLLSLPFAVKLLDRRMAALMASHDRLAILLGVKGWSRLRVLTLPPLKKDLGLVVGLTAALSVGDLGVIALFAQPDFQTLPWLLYQLAGTYAAGEAAGLALVLLALTIVMFVGARVLVGLIITLISGGRNA